MPRWKTSRAGGPVVTAPLGWYNRNMKSASSLERDIKANSSLDRDDLVRSVAKLETKLRDLGVTSLSIFGSRARGDYRPESDLDVLIDVSMPGKFSLLDLVGIAHLIEDSVHIPTNIFMKRSVGREFSASIENDLVEVF